MGSLSLHHVITVNADRGHETKGTEALCDNIRLDITVVVLAGPDESTISLDYLSDNIVDQSVLVVQALCLHLLKVLFTIDALEGVNEKAIILLQDGVLARHLKREVSVESVAETGASESFDGLVRVEHAKVDASVDVSNVLNRGLASVSGRIRDLNGTGLGHQVILAAVLVAESVPSNDNWLSPAWHAAGNVRDNNGLSKDGSIKNVSNCSIGTPPHLLEVELFDTALVGGDSGALNGNLVPLGGLSAINGDLIVSSVTVCHGQVVVLGLEVEVRVDVAFLDPLPDHTSHLIAIDINDGVGNLHLAECSAEVSNLHLAECSAEVSLKFLH